MGIVYTTSKLDEDEGLAFSHFLDALVSLAFEAEANVAGALQKDWDKKNVLRKAPQEALQRGGKAPQGRLPSPGALPAAAVDVGVCPSSPTDPATGLHRSSKCGAPSRTTPVRFALGQGAPEDGDRPSVALARKKDTKTRFLAVPGMGASTVMDKVNGVNKIKSLAVSRAHSVYLSRATSLMPSRRPSNDGGDEDDTDEGLFSDDDSHDDDSGEEERHPAGAGGISPAQLTM
ncbi:uncharacterized protein HaLaN_02536 [Haematococcus lacustris]|uniref:Uncharacterized protein n=1 Tax=Haematococcus lacustris TaxID=44745 RepID=A0A699YE63_HAELA|nr:uncharacterized protein HaLaN_02536 [Haematococcus lacustris]